jgi:hypothetical protein
VRGALIVFLLWLQCAVASTSDNVCRWEWVNPAPPRESLYGAIFGNGRFVAVGAGGIIVTSLDGETWVPRDSGVTADLYAVDFAAARYVVVGDGVVLSSRDAISWTVRHEQQGAVFHDVDYGASRFVVVGSGFGDGALTSTDGENWSAQAAGLPSDVHGVVMAGDTFYACSTVDVFSSADGESWIYTGSVPYSPPKTEPSDLLRYDLGWNGARLIWMGGTQAWRSADGETWDFSLEVDGYPDLSRFVGILGVGSVVILSGVGAQPASLFRPEGHLYVSSDGGDNWLRVWSEFSGGFPALAHRLGKYLALGAGGDVLESANAYDWSCQGSGCTSSVAFDGFRDAVVALDQVVAVGGVGMDDAGKRFGGGTVASSANGRSWTVDALEIESIRGMSSWRSQFVAVGDGWAATSVDGIDWEVHEVPSSSALNSVTRGADVYLAVGECGEVVTSAEGELWLEDWSLSSEDLQRVVWNGERFFVVGNSGTILTARWIGGWERETTASGEDLWGVVTGDPGSVAVGDNGTILVRDQSRHWAGTVSGTEAHLRDVTWSEGRYAAVGFEGGSGVPRRAAVLASEDGVHWTSFAAPGSALRRVVGLWDGFVAVGDERTLLHAGCLGVLIGLDPQISSLLVGEYGELRLTLDDDADSDIRVDLSTRGAGVVEVPGEVTVRAGSDYAVIPVWGQAVGEVWLTATLPAEVGGGRTKALLEVYPQEWTPRRPSGRHRP